MATEIERKFLVSSDEYKKLALPIFYKQGYLSASPSCIVRVRIAGAKAYLTIKGKTKGLTRDEFEYEIPVQEATEMLSKMALTNIIEKNRYIIEYNGNTWEVDEFLGDNTGLVIAEIELQSEDAAFSKPAWVGKEVSDDGRYFNSSLSQNPYKDWK
jgi:adenylate cyclase